MDSDTVTNYLLKKCSQWRYHSNKVTWILSITFGLLLLNVFQVGFLTTLVTTYFADKQEKVHHVSVILIKYNKIHNCNSAAVWYCYCCYRSRRQVRVLCDISSAGVYSVFSCRCSSGLLSVLCTPLNNKWASVVSHVVCEHQELKALITEHESEWVFVWMFEHVESYWWWQFMFLQPVWLD